MIFNIMRLKSALQPVLSGFSGAALGFLVWWAYWNLNVIPGTAWPAIVSSPLMHAIRELSPDLDIPIAITIKALPLSLLLGFIGGCLQPRFKFSQTYCYSVLLWPLAYSYLATTQSGRSTLSSGRTRKHSGVRGMTIGLLLSPYMVGSLRGSMLGLLSQSAAYQLNPPDWLQVALRATRSQSGNL